MDHQTTDCPCKRLRVSEGDNIDQETGMVISAVERNIGLNDTHFQQGEVIQETFSNHEEATASNSTDARGDTLRRHDLSRNTKREKHPDLFELPSDSGDGNQSAKERNLSPGHSEYDQSQRTGAGTQLQTDKGEAGILCCIPDLQTSVGKNLKERQVSGVCEYVQNLQAIAESSYIRARERKSSENEIGRMKSLESPKLKRTIDRIDTNIAQQRVESLSGSPVELNVPVNDKVESDTFETDSGFLESLKQGYSGKIVYNGLTGRKQNLDRILPELFLGSRSLEKEESKENNVEEVSKTTFKQDDQNYSISSKAVIGTQSDSSGGSIDSVRYIHESLDDSGFIEMFSNSVMGNVIGSCGNRENSRYSGNLCKGTWKNSGKFSKNSYMSYDQKQVENRNEEVGDNISNDGMKDEEVIDQDVQFIDNDCTTRREHSESDATCKFGELSSLLEDIGQTGSDNGCQSHKSVVKSNSYMQKDVTSVRHDTNDCWIKCKSENENTKSVIIGGDNNSVGNSSKMICVTSSFVCTEVDTKQGSRQDIGDVMNISREGDKTQLNVLHHSSINFSAESIGTDLKKEYQQVSTFINGRFKLDFEQTQEIIHQSDINRLPITILVHILKNLTVFQLLRRASFVCKYWYNLCRDPDIWRSICLVNQHRLSDIDLERLLSFSGHRVQNVNLTDCRFVTNNGIKYLVLNCPQIEVLKVMRCFDLTDEAFKGIHTSSSCRNLQVLYMDGCCRITDSTVKEVSEACPELRSLHLNQCTRVSDSGIISVAKHCPHLTDLQLDHCSQVTDESLSDIVIGCPSMLYLNLMCCGVTDTGVKYLAKLSKLSNLDLSNIPRLTSHSVIYLSKFCRNLQCINVSLNAVMDDDCIAQLAKNLPALKRLYFVSCSISDKGLEDIAKYRSTLEALDVGWCQEVTDHGVRVISHACKNLDYFGLIRCDKVTVETIEELVLKYPKINYSTFVLESRRLLERAREKGYQFSLPSK